MSELISGKEALIALANGNEVEYYKHEWKDANRLSVRDLTSSDNMYKFRLKPRTITINGIECPAPFEPKFSEFFYYITASCEDGYASRRLHDDTPDHLLSIGAWSTETEIKQVVEALRSVFKPQ